MAGCVLTDPSLLRLLLAYQDGLYEDVRDRLADAMFCVRLDDDGRYYHLPNVVEPVSTTRTLFLSLPAYDFRLPVHWTIVEGQLRLLMRVAACRPQLLTRDALYCAVASGDLPIVSYLCSLDLAPGRLTEPLLDLAVSHGSIALLELLVGAGFSRASPRAAAIAAERGDMDVLEYLASRSCDVTQAVATAAARGFLDIIIYLHARGVRGTSPAVVDGAAMHGHANVVAFLLQDGGYTNSATAWTLAANDGHLHVLQLLHQHDAPHCSSNAMDYAATEGHLEAVTFLHTHRNECGATTDAIDGASANGHLSVVQYLCANRTEGWTHRALDDAAGGGHLEVVVFLLQWGPPALSQRAVTQAAANGHAMVLQHLLAAQLQGVSATAAAACAVAEHGHLDALQVLYAYRQSGWNTSVWFAAFAHLDVLTFLLTHAPECVDADASLVPTALSVPVARLLQSALGHHLRLNLRQDDVGVLALFPGYPWSETTMREAIRSGNLAMVRYLHEHEHDHVCSADLLATAASVPGNTDVFTYLAEHCVRATSEDVWIQAARHGNLAILEALHANQSLGATPAVMDEAARVGAVDVLRFLHDHRREGCSTRAMFDAITYGHWRVVAFLCRHGEPGVSNEASCRNIEIAIEAFDPEWTEARLSDVLPLLLRRLDALRA
ncbi:hypothetical protein SPRG_19386 [Saprolegnia parasitica CBS 223.65]|uniref:Uncharacterized protein n=1 Tax=Saprolegnia parasitica (strain CBS 223.65) TaxID=695850 RepID=A0A067D2F8_SAPPC|nr:hypothetical protein SPRG_19386 [Saprolegnia parasitica CBS 223.65]KDO33177.1 hypothetical protein SPRG_19386 [Saprolegnia parasitica CBS 223.65]|eukprot:XP_012196267.1 hypothetical protein SPRG_19386 [Saprolegnia parasitica CBS 223.65]